MNADIMSEALWRPGRVRLAVWVWGFVVVDRHRWRLDALVLLV